MRNKIVVMIFTFVLMIALTPLVFGKLMNAKFDKMLNQVKSEGIELKQIQDKSSYLQTDRVFEVIIPGKLLNVPEIEYIKAVVEAKFKNLPVTTADFEGVVKEIKTKNFDNRKINEFIKDKIKFFVTTPNFRVYKYKIYDTSFDLNGAVLKITGTQGVLVYPDKNQITVAKIELKGIKKPIEISLNNFKNVYEKKNNEVLNSSSFNLKGDFGKFKFSVDNFNSKNVVIFSAGKVNSVGDLSVKDINISNMLKINGIKANVKINGLDEKTVMLLQKAPRYERDRLALQLVSKGFQINAKVNVQNIDYASKNLGFIDLTLFADIKPVKNIEEKIKADDFDFVNFEIDLKTTPTIATFLAMLDPKIAMILQNAKQTKNGIELDIKKQNNKIFINGKEIKSD